MNGARLARPPEWARASALALVLGLVLVLLNAGLGTRWQSTATVAGLWALAGVGLGLIWGYAGQVQLGQGGFIAIGAYSSALLTTRFGLPPLLALLIGIVASCGVAYVLGRFVLRLEELYLALATLGFGLITPAVIVALPDVTGGSVGVYGIPMFSIGPLVLNQTVVLYAFTWSLAAAATWGAARLGSSRHGLTWKVIAHHPTVAAACGADVEARKMDAFFLSAGLASTAGSLFAHFSSAVTPGSFSFSLVVLLLTIVVVGGLGAASGAVVGAVVINLLLTYSGQARELTDVVFGGVFILVLFLAPKGIVGLVQSWIRRRTQPTPASIIEPVAVTSIDASTHAGPDAGGRPVLQVLHITKAFGGLVANRDVSLTLAEGQIHGIVGPNGAGKTTLINMISGIYTPDAGELIYHGSNITSWPAGRRAYAGMSRTFQSPALVLDLSVLDNVALGAYRFGKQGIAPTLFGGSGQREIRAMRERAAATLALVGLGHRTDLPASELSFGQKRLAELARALALSPELLFLDEPMSGLDAYEKEHVAQIIRGLGSQGTAICLVEHDTEMIARLCNWVTVLDFGAVLADGPGDSVFHDPRVRASYMGEMLEAVVEGTPTTPARAARI